MNPNIITLIVFFISYQVFSQVGIKTENPNLFSDLTLGSSNKALLLNKVADAESTLGANAEDGMLLYDTGKQCFRGYQNGTWINITPCTNGGASSAVASITNSLSYQINQAFQIEGIISNYSGAYTYVWERSTSVSGPWGVIGTSISSSGSTFNGSFTESSVGTFYYRAHLTINGQDIYSNTCTVTTFDTTYIEDATISNPSGVSANTSFVMKLVYTGGQNPTNVQWQSSSSAGGPWNNISSTYTSGLYILPGVSNGTYYYRALITTSVNSLTSNVVQVIVPRTVCTSPQAPSVYINGGQTAAVHVGSSFSISTTGASQGTTPYHYQWQKRLSGGGFTNISGATNSTLTTSETTSGLYFYRVEIWSDGCSESNAAYSTGSYGIAEIYVVP